MTTKNNETGRRYFIRVKAPSSDIPFNLHYLAEHDQLALSKGRRLCSLFSKSMATFDTEAEATEFLATVKQNPNYGYSVKTYQ